MENGIEDAHAHIADSTGVHGISDTANLVYTSDARLSDQRTPTDGSVTTAKIADGAITTAKILDGTIALDDLAAAVQNLLVPSGSIIQFGGETSPTGWVICDGSELAIASYASLYAAISNKYGSLTNGSGGSGTTHFRVPDLRGRVPVGKGTHSDVSTLGNNDGSALANRRPKHGHTIYDPGHVHAPKYGNTFWANPGGGAVVGSGSFIPMNGVDNATTATSTTGMKVNPEGANTSSSPNDAPAYIVVNYIIKT